MATLLMVYLRSPRIRQQRQVGGVNNLQIGLKKMAHLIFFGPIVIFICHYKDYLRVFFIVIIYQLIVAHLFTCSRWLFIFLSYIFQDFSRFFKIFQDFPFCSLSLVLGNFLLQFFLLSFIFGIPMLCFYACLGQFLGSGVIDMWRISPIFKVGLSFFTHHHHH